jgi:hypothetical protein
MPILFFASVFPFLFGLIFPCICGRVRVAVRPLSSLVAVFALLISPIFPVAVFVLLHGPNLPS